jgi:hypothetical protein
VLVKVAVYCSMIIIELGALAAPLILVLGEGCPQP